MEYDFHAELVDYDFDPYEGYGDVAEFQFVDRQRVRKNRRARQERQALKAAKETVNA